MAKSQAKPAPRTAGRTPENEPPERMEPRVEDPNVIYNRLGEPIDLAAYMEPDADVFSLKAAGIEPPAGWVYAWRTKTIKNWEWRAHQVGLARRGWTPVPADRHDGAIMPRGHTGPIEQSGLVLMEIPEKAYKIARALEKRGADGAIQASRQMAGLMQRSTPGGLGITDYAHPEAQKATGVRIEREAVNVVRTTKPAGEFSVD